MEIKKLKELNAKKEKTLKERSAELIRLNNEIRALDVELAKATMEGNEPLQDKIIDDMSKLRKKAEATENVIRKLEAKGNPFFTDEDVLNGFSEYAKAYNKKASGIRRRYEEGISTAYQAIKDNAEMRKEGLAVRDQYKEFLCSESAHFEKLDTIAWDRRAGYSLFKDVAGDEAKDSTKWFMMMADPIDL